MPGSFRGGLLLNLALVAQDEPRSRQLVRFHREWHRGSALRDGVRRVAMELCQVSLEEAAVVTYWFRQCEEELG